MLKNPFTRRRRPLARTRTIREPEPMPRIRYP
jgi:hypothetical protein